MEDKIKIPIRCLKERKHYLEFASNRHKMNDIARNLDDSIQIQEFMFGQYELFRRDYERMHNEKCKECKKKHLRKYEKFFQKFFPSCTTLQLTHPIRLLYFF